MMKNRRYSKNIGRLLWRKGRANCSASGRNRHKILFLQHGLGVQFEIKKSLVLSENTVRSIPAETRSLLKDYAKLYQRLKAEEEKFERAKKPIQDAMVVIDTKTLRYS